MYHIQLPIHENNIDSFESKQGIQVVQFNLLENLFHIGKTSYIAFQSDPFGDIITSFRVRILWLRAGTLWLRTVTLWLRAGTLWLGTLWLGFIFWFGIAIVIMIMIIMCSPMNRNIKCGRLHYICILIAFYNYRRKTKCLAIMQ